MYKQLVFYLEACESGSMFNNILPTDINVYASSAASPYESSYAMYCGGDAMVNGTNIGSCLGDEYSITWMEDSDLETPKESITEQFVNIKKRVVNSQPMEWGDRTFEAELVTDFLGTTDADTESDLYSKIKSFTDRLLHTPKKTSEEEYYLNLVKQRSAMDSRSVKLDYLFRKANKTGLLQDTTTLNNELNLIKTVDAIFLEFSLKLQLNTLGERNENIQFECLRNSVNHYKVTCQNWAEYTLKYVKNISTACKKYTEETVKSTFDEICKHN